MNSKETHHEKSILILGGFKRSRTVTIAKTLRPAPYADQHKGRNNTSQLSYTK